MAIRFPNLATKFASVAALIFVFGVMLTLSSAAQPMASASTRYGVDLAPCQVEGVKEKVRCGVHNVFENRQTSVGRKLPLKIVVIPARRPHPNQGPIFYLAGGPGATATELASDLIEAGDSDEHDVVLVDERGSGDGHRLDCPSPGSDNNLGGYLAGPFDPAAARACSHELEQRFDLSQYTTANFADDLDEVRKAMGYGKINLAAGSFGTNAALTYMRRHGEHVRSAYLTSLVTLSNRVPLYHAWAAQHALEQLFRGCDQDLACRNAYPRLRENFAAVLAKVRGSPVRTWVNHPVTGAKTEILLSEPAFVDAVRVMMYSGERGRTVPFLIEQAKAGDFRPFADAAVRTNRGFYPGVRMGLHYAITCNEFVARINPKEVEPATRRSYLGPWRVRAQMAACNEWPKTNLPADYFQSFRSDVPTVLISGEVDPVDPPLWGEEVKSFLSNSVHLVVPGAGHTPDNACTQSIRAQLFRSGATTGLNLTCIAKVQPAPFKLPSKASAKKPAPLDGV